jgi:hypothetical protein
MATCSAEFWADQHAQHRTYTLDIVCADCKQIIEANSLFILPPCDHPLHKKCFVKKIKHLKICYNCPECQVDWDFEKVPERCSYIK